MNRRQLIAGVGTAGISAVVVGGAYLADQGVIDIGDEAAVSEDVSRSAESFSFDAAVGEDIFITISVQEEGDARGAFTLRDPAGDEVVDGRIGLGTETNATHRAEQGGTYQLTVHPRDARLHVSVSVTDPDE